MKRAVRTSHQRSNPAESHKPGLRNLLRTIGLDVEYEKASGDFLYYRDAHSRNVEVLDLVGGYGSLLLGHNRPELIAEATRFFAMGQPNHTQGSMRSGAERLAQALSARVGDDMCAVFANSGAEAVEAALKHALLETGGRTLIVLEGGFHGKTTGALQLTANPHFRKPFEAGGLNVIRVKPDDPEQLRAAFAQAADPAGFLFEPIQGEAGIRPLKAEFIQLAASLCAEHGVPLIADECQSGIGRTGDFLASHSLGVFPDYIILSKALGGGLAKISALLVKRERYQQTFDLLHSSTFADDEFSCVIALKTLELLDSSLIQKCRSQGEYLLGRLRTLQQQYSTVIADVRGVGLMIGVELQRPAETSAFLLNFIAQRNLLGPLVSGYLLRERRIRIAPTLSDSFTLRVQPSACVTQAQLDSFVAALADVCDRLQANDVVGLTRFLSATQPVVDPIPTLPGGDGQVIAFHSVDFWRQEKSLQRREKPPCRRVAWLFHLIDENDLTHLEPAFDRLTVSDRSVFLERFSPLAEPVVMDAVEIRSVTGGRVLLYPIVLPVTSAWLLQGTRGKGWLAARSLVQKAVDTAAKLNCQVVSLGQFTSIVTRSGRTLQNRDMFVATGNNYTAALVAQSIHCVLESRDLDSRELTLAVIGAAGDIGSTCAAMLASEFRRTILVGSGRAGSHQLLQQTASRLPGSEPARDLSRISSADVVICATNCITAPLGPEHLHPRAIICDVSVPATLRTHTAEILPEVTIVPGAIAELPFGEDLCIPGFPLPPGHIYGCMAEALLLGLEGVPPQTWVGRSCAQRAAQIAEIAARHGFKPAAQQFGYPTSENAPCQR